MSLGTPCISFASCTARKTGRDESCTEICQIGTRTVVMEPDTELASVSASPTTFTHQLESFSIVAYNPAIISISTNASLGKRATCTVDRAGGADVKYFAYTSFMAAKSFMSFRKTVVFTT